MIRARGTGIAAVVRCNHEHVVCAHRGKKAREPIVELLHGTRIARNVAAVSVDHVAVDEVDERNPRKVLREEFRGLCHAVRIRFIYAERAGEPAAAEDIRDLADTDHITPRTV